jgi:hypothetical protein
VPGPQHVLPRGPVAEPGIPCWGRKSPVTPADRQPTPSNGNEGTPDQPAACVSSVKATGLAQIMAFQQEKVPCHGSEGWVLSACG